MVLYSVEFDYYGVALTGSETGRPKLILYNRPPNGPVNISSIRLVASFPMSLGLSVRTLRADLDHLCPLHTIALDTGEICIIFVHIRAI